MNTVIEQLSNLNIKNSLEKDIDYLILCYKNNVIQIDINKLKLKKLNSHPDNIRYLYYDILKYINSISETHIILDMMPLIDEYLDYHS